MTVRPQEDLMWRLRFDFDLFSAGAKDNLLKVWNLTTGDVSQSLVGHTAPITCIAFAPSGLFVVSGSDDTTLRIFGLALGVVEATFQVSTNLYDF